MKTYYIMLSKVFMKPHKRAGEPTNFAEKLRKTKIHTIRTNYYLWRKRFEEIERGKACLSIRQWEGTPHRSKQIEIARLTKEDGIGLEKLCIYETMNGILVCMYVEGEAVEPQLIAKNDGLDFEDWIYWFDKPEMISTIENERPLPIIHFTPFRYAE